MDACYNRTIRTAALHLPQNGATAFFISCLHDVAAEYAARDLAKAKEQLQTHLANGGTGKDFENGEVK